MSQTARTWRSQDGLGQSNTSMLKQLLTASQIRGKTSHSHQLASSYVIRAGTYRSDTLSAWALDAYPGMSMACWGLSHSISKKASLVGQ